MADRGSLPCRPCARQGQKRVYVGNFQYYAVDRRTGAVWSAVSCGRIARHGLSRLQAALRKRIGLTNAEYEPLKGQIRCANLGCHVRTPEIKPRGSGQRITVDWQVTRTCSRHPTDWYFPDRTDQLRALCVKLTPANRLPSGAASGASWTDRAFDALFSSRQSGDGLQKWFHSPGTFRG
jgi:hypothetical protein